MNGFPAKKQNKVYSHRHILKTVVITLYKQNNQNYYIPLVHKKYLGQVHKKYKYPWILASAFLHKNNIKFIHTDTDRTKQLLHYMQQKHENYYIPLSK
jgi:hypothetical protein